MPDETPPEFSDRSRVTGLSDPDTHRAAEGEGVRAPLAQDGADHSEFSVFDGAGNESVVVVTTDADGKTTQATGETSAAAAKSAKKQDGWLGKAFGDSH